MKHRHRRHTPAQAPLWALAPLPVQAMLQLLPLSGCNAFCFDASNQILLLLAWLQANITVGNCVLMLEQADHYKMQKLSEVGSSGSTAVQFSKQCDSPSPPCETLCNAGSLLGARPLTAACDALPLQRCQKPCSAVQAWQSNWIWLPCHCITG